MTFRMHSCRRAVLRGMGAIAVSGLTLVALPGAARAADRPADPSNLASVFAAAQPGDTVLLASGSYTFQGGIKAGMVTVKPQPGATASMRVDFRPAANITLDGLAITGLTIGDSRSHNITVRNSRFDQSQATLRTGELVNANILFDNNTHIGYVAGSGGGEGRIFLPEKTSQPSGVTIQHSLFQGGNSDGIQNGGRGVRILDNEFRDMQQIDGASGVHADSIQLYGSAETVIQGNWFHDVAVGIMCADGCDHEVVQDNVFAVTGSPYAVQLLSDAGSVFRHNTMLDYGTCDYNQPCGILYLGNKSSDPASSGTVLKDNIVTRVCVCSGSVSGLAEQSHNLITNGAASGTSDVRGKPTYVGGPGPKTFAGFALAPGSLGKGNASDGTDRGARVTGIPGLRTGAPAAPPSGPPAPGAGGGGAAAGLVAAYGFDERSGKRVKDASGSGNRGRLHGVRRTRSGHSGGALVFDGSGDVVSVRDSRSLDLRSGMTLEAWVRTAGSRRSGRAVLAKRRRGGVSYALYSGDKAGRPAAVATNNPRRAARAQKKLRRKRWTHLAMTFDGAHLRLYVDGTLAAERHRSRPLKPGGGPLRIGAGAAGRFFKGKIDDVRIYNRALGADAIGQDMRTPV
jgi:hypothetical protein